MTETIEDGDRMNNSDPMETSFGTQAQEMSQQLLEWFMDGLLVTLAVIIAAVLAIGVMSFVEASRARRRRALAQEELRTLAISDGMRAPALPAKRGYTWRLQVRRWTFALSIARIEKSA